MPDLEASQECQQYLWTIWKAVKEKIILKPPAKSQGLQERSQKPWDDAEKQVVWRVGQETSWSTRYSRTQPAITANRRGETCHLHQPAFTTTRPKAGSQDVFQGKEVPWWKLAERTRRWDCWRGGLSFTTQSWKQKHAHLVLTGRWNSCQAYC